MNDNTISLICYLKSQLVYKHGFINEAQLNNNDRSLIEGWRLRGWLKIEPLQHPNRAPKPGSIKDNIEPATRNPQPDTAFTHRIWLSEKLWNLAIEAEKQRAERTNPFVKKGKEMKLVEKSLRSGGDSEGGAPQPGTRNPQPELDIEDFKKYVADHGSHLQEQQERAAEAIFNALNEKKMITWVQTRSTGTSWLLRAIDQYITTCTHVQT